MLLSVSPDSCLEDIFYQAAHDLKAEAGVLFCRDREGQSVFQLGYGEVSEAKAQWWDELSFSFAAQAEAAACLPWFREPERQKGNLIRCAFPAGLLTGVIAFSRSAPGFTSVDCNRLQETAGNLGLIIGERYSCVQELAALERLGRELHKSVCQYLTAALLELELYRLNLGEDEKRDGRRLEERVDGSDGVDGEGGEEGDVLRAIELLRVGSQELRRVIYKYRSFGDPLELLRKGVAQPVSDLTDTGVSG